MKAEAGWRRGAAVVQPVGRAALVLALACLAAAAGAGCGRSNEAGGARERDEPRSYGHVVVRSDVAPRRVTLGDPVVWTLTATLPESTRVETVVLEPAPPSLEIVPRGPGDARPSRGGTVWSRVYDVRGFDLGLLPLPTATLTLAVGRNEPARRDSLVFPEDSLAVDSLTPMATGILSPDRGPIDPGLRPIDKALAIALGLLVLGVIAALVWRFRRPRPAAPAAPPDPPETIFARAVEALRHDGPGLSRGAFHDRLSDAVRRYVGAVAGVDAIDLTTRELESALKRSPRTRDSAAGEVTRILRRSDLVKFARREDAWEEARALLEDASRLPESVAPAPAPAAPAAGPAPAAPVPPAAPPARGASPPPREP